MQEDKTREQECESVPILFNARGQDKGVNGALEIRPIFILSLVNTLNNNNIIEYINISSSLCYSELFSGWIKNTNPLRRATKKTP